MIKRPVRRINGRHLGDAYGNAERIREELPHLIQPSNSDIDLVLLLEEVQSQEQEIGDCYKLINLLRQKLDSNNNYKATHATVPLF